MSNGKVYSQSTPKSKTRFFKQQHQRTDLYSLVIELEVDEDPAVKLVQLTVLLNDGPFPGGKTNGSGATPASPSPLYLTGSGAIKRIISVPVRLSEDDELSFAVDRLGGGTDDTVPPWNVRFNLISLTGVL